MVAIIQSKYRSLYWFIHGVKCFFSNQYKKLAVQLSELVGFRIVIASTKKESKRRALEMRDYNSKRWNSFKSEGLTMVGDVIDERYSLFLCIKESDSDQ